MPDQDGAPGAVRASGDDLRHHAEAVAAQPPEQWNRMQDTLQAMRAVTETVLSKDGSVAVTAVWGGAVTGMAFPSDAHRTLSGDALAELVLTTIVEAQRRVTTTVSTILAPTLPPGTDAARALATGIRAQADGGTSASVAGA